METLDRIYKLVQQSSSGISAIAIAKKLKPGGEKDYRTTVHRHLNSLELMGKVRDEHGLWFDAEKPQTPNEATKKVYENMRKLWADITSLRLNPQLRHREDGSSYYYRWTFEIMHALRILSKMHPSLDVLYESAFRNSVCNRFGPDVTPEELRNLIQGLNLTIDEMDSLIGELGKAIDEIIEC